MQVIPTDLVLWDRPLASLLIQNILTPIAAIAMTTAKISLILQTKGR